MVQWIKILPHAIIHTVLVEQEFRENVLLRYKSHQTDLPEKYDGYTSKKPFNIQHDLQCKVGGLVAGRNNKVCDSLLVTNAFYYYSIHDKPIISSSRYISGPVYLRKTQLDNIIVYSS